MGSTATALGLRAPRATVPLISTSLGLFYAFVETTYFQAFLSAAKHDDQSVRRTVRLWWPAYLPAGLFTIGAIGLTTLAGGIYTLRGLQSYTTAWYTCVGGIVAGLGHFAFGPTVARFIKMASDEEEEKEGRTFEWVRKWLDLHYWRAALTDIPAFAAFAYLVFYEVV